MSHIVHKRRTMAEEEQPVMADDTATTLANCAEIPQELLREIMSRLPGKSMVRFNCVSKLWSYSLTVTAFLLRHSRYTASPTASPDFYYAFCFSDFKNPPSKRTLQLFSFQIDSDEFISKNNNDYYSSTPTVKTIPVPLPTLPPVFDPRCLMNVSNFCDGLVCVFNFYDRSQNFPVFLYSLRSHDFSALPTTSLCLPPCAHLARFHWCLLGFDPTRGQYRVVRSIKREGATERSFYCEYEILTIGSKSWKLLDHDNVPRSIRNHGYTTPSRGCFCLNGVIYWLHWKDPNDTIIASIDLSREEFRALEVNQLNGHRCQYENNYNYNYFLAPLNGHPTLLKSDWGCKNVWQWTFSEPQNSNPVCVRRIFPSYIPSSNQSTNFPYISGTMIHRRLDYKRYFCYDVENGVSWVIETEGGWEVLKIC